MKKLENMVLDQCIGFTKESIKHGEKARPVFAFMDGTELKLVDLNMIPDKDEWSEFMRLVIADKKPSEYVFICESWMKMFDANNEIDKRQSEALMKGLKQVHDYDDKVECIIVVHGKYSKFENTGVIRFERRDEEVIFFEIEWMPDTVSGRFAKLFRPFTDNMNIN
jgi:hypothetical protein